MKDFIIMGNLLSSSHNGVKEHIINGEITFGPSIRNGGRYFIMPDDYPSSGTQMKIIDGKRCERIKGVRWYTNLSYDFEGAEPELTRKYDPLQYVTYDNCKAIHIDRIKDIPCDYDDLMGVPITILDKMGSDGIIHFKSPDLKFKIIRYLYGDDGKYLSINGKIPFTRVLIKKI